MKILKFVFSLLSNICYVLIGIYLLVSIPGVLGFTPLIVMSGSMSPTYNKWSVLYYDEVDVSEIEEMDVITFASGSDLNVTHRVFKIVDEGFVTKGDANLSPDTEIVNFNEVKGKVLDFNIPFVGCYINFVNNHSYLVVIVVLILVSEFFIDNMENLKIKFKMKGVELV